MFVKKGVNNLLGYNKDSGRSKIALSDGTQCFDLKVWNPHPILPTPEYDNIKSGFSQEPLYLQWTAFPISHVMVFWTRLDSRKFMNHSLSHFSTIFEHPIGINWMHHYIHVIHRLNWPTQHRTICGMTWYAGNVLSIPTECHTFVAVNRVLIRRYLCT